MLTANAALSDGALNGVGPGEWDVICTADYWALSISMMTARHRQRRFVRMPVRPVGCISFGPDSDGLGVCAGVLHPIWWAFVDSELIRSSKETNKVGDLNAVIYCMSYVLAIGEMRLIAVSLTRADCSSTPYIHC